MPHQADLIASRSLTFLNKVWDELRVNQICTCSSFIHEGNATYRVHFEP